MSPGSTRPTSSTLGRYPARPGHDGTGPGHVLTGSGHDGTYYWTAEPATPVTRQGQIECILVMLDAYRCGPFLNVSYVASSVCLFLCAANAGTLVSCAETTEPIDMSCGIRLVCPRNFV